MVRKMCSADHLGFRDRITGDPWIHFSNGYLVVYLLLKPKELYFVKNNHGTPLIGDGNYSQIMQCRATYNILLYIRSYSFLKYNFLI